ncbi:hypothetical protein Trydic_g22034 [Trypoxylus dichotomus]
MDACEILLSPDESTRNTIVNVLSEAALEKAVKGFKDWLKDEPGVPNSVDEQLIRNVISYSQFDLSVAKQRFQGYVQYRTKHEAYVTSRKFSDNFMDDLSLHRQVILIPRHLPGGYKIVYARFLPNVDQFDFKKLLNLLYFYVDFFLCEQFCSGYIGLYDLEHFKLEHLEKVDIKRFIDVFNFIYNLQVFPIKAIHFINVPPTVPEHIIKLVKQLDNGGLAAKTYFHKSLDELKEYIPNGVLPKQYGGNGDDLDELSENFQKYLVREKNWRRKVDNLKYTGPLPQTDYGVYGLNE